MSGAPGYMLLAVRNRIRSEVIPRLSSSGSEHVAACEITDSGKPVVSYQGLIFFGVHSGGFRNTDADPQYYATDLTYDFRVTVSMKTSHISTYRQGDVKISDGTSGIVLITDLVVVSLNGYLSLAEEANTLLTADYPNDQPFITGERPVFQTAETPKERTASWFGATQSDSGKLMGFSQEARFQGLRLIRPVGQH